MLECHSVRVTVCLIHLGERPKNLCAFLTAAARRTVWGRAFVGQPQMWSLDGFNANHSNLRLLAVLPIAKLRVDPWLICRMANRVAEAQLFAAILGAARGLGIAVCATGVASADMLAAVLQHGRPLAQGAAVAASLDGREFLERLRDSSVATVNFQPLDLDHALLAHDSSSPESFKDRFKMFDSRSRPSSEAASYS